jgi:chaperone modulatory protein CbpM
MTAHVVEVAWLDARETVTMAELSRICGLTEAELEELLEFGALEPIDKEGPERLFSAECIGTLRRAATLRRDFDLDLFAIALLLDYLHRIDLLERQLKSLQAHLPGHAHGWQREGPQPWREPHGTAVSDLPVSPSGTAEPGLDSGFDSSR